MEIWKKKRLLVEIFLKPPVKKVTLELQYFSQHTEYEPI